MTVRAAVIAPITPTGQPSRRLADIPPRRFDVVELGECYRLTCQSLQISFELDRLTWHHQDLGGELMVKCDFLGTDAVDGVLSLATFNVSSARARTERARQLERQSRAYDVPWDGLIEELCQRVLLAERTGAPAIALRDVPKRDDTQRLISLAGFSIPWKLPSILFGDGASGKSYLALYLTGLLAQQGYRVGIFDWELDEDDHRERFERLFGCDMPATVFYTACRRPLTYDVDRLKRMARQQAFDFALYDSVGFACHEAPETAEAALAYFRAVRQIGLGSIHIAHINKSEGGDQKPFGSSFWYNSGRAIWNMKATEDGSGGLTLGIFDRKPSTRAKQAPFALHMSFEHGRTIFTSSDIADSEFSSKLSVPQRLRHLLKNGAQKRELLSGTLDVSDSTLSRTINREIQHGRLVRFRNDEHIEMIGLARKSGQS